MSEEISSSRATSGGGVQWDAAATIDARGLRCPQPLLAMRRALREEPAGRLVRVLATDPGSWRDFHSFAELSGQPLLRAECIDGEFRYWLLATT
ncbi:sulfurtransferase TusA family protein [Microbulbifer sp. TYP-18]|uniref:sulfurtransferase TusA family protein n=1 Tax=Microbulbifer sp. TYP-18 TaxID=3230024 RepID=UPI0034C5EB77